MLIVERTISAIIVRRMLTCMMSWNSRVGQVLKQFSVLSKSIESFLRSMLVGSVLIRAISSIMKQLPLSALSQLDLQKNQSLRRLRMLVVV